MNVLFAIAAVAFAIWGCVFMRRASLLHACVIWIAASACLGYAFWKAPGSVPLTVDRLMFLGLLGMLGLHMWLGRTERLAWGATEWILVAFLAYLGISMALTGWSASEAKTTAPMWRYAWGYLVPISVFFVARLARPTERNLRGVCTLLIVLGVYLGITALLEINGQWSFVFPKHIADEKLGIHFGRARGPMLQSDLLGIFLGVALLATTLWLARLGPWGRWTAVALVPLFLAAIVVTYTRAVWLGTGTAAFALALLMLTGRQRIIAVTAMALLAGGVLVTKWDSLLAFQRDMHASDTRDSAISRVTFAYVSWLMFQDYPVAGVGFGHYPEAKLPYLADRETHLKLYIIKDMYHHNTFLSLLTETGLIGVALFSAIIIAILRDGWIVWNDRSLPLLARTFGPLLWGVLGYYAFALLTYEVSYTGVDSALVFFLAGTVRAIRWQGIHRWGTATAFASDERHASLPARLATIG